MSRKGWVVAAVLAAACALVLALPLTASAEHTNEDCAMCHGATGMLSNADFVVGAVDKDTACRACHRDGFVGTHPYHNGGGDCSSVCHRNFGPSLAANVPVALTSAGAFANPLSPNLPSYILHSIHSTPRWPAGQATNSSKCGSCHATAACTACHNGIPADYVEHEMHADPSVGYDESTITITPWEGYVSYGVVSSEIEDTKAYESVRCGAAGCHDTTGTVEAAPALMDSYTHPTYPGGYIPTTVTKVGTWREVASSSYTLGRMAYANYATSSLSITFNGERITVMSDRDPYRGIAQILIDDVPVATVDQYYATTQYQRPIWTSGDLGPGPHKFTIRPTGTKNIASRGTWVSFDQIKVYGAADDSIAPECGSCHPMEVQDTHGGVVGGFSHDMTQTIVSTNLWATGYGNYSCDKCHQVVMFDEHGRNTSSSKPLGTCAACHTTHAPYSWTGTLNLTDGCSYGAVGACHTVVSGNTPHNGVDASHLATTTGQAPACAGCHGSDVRATHNNSIPGNSKAETLGCTVGSGCHSNSAIAPSTLCTNCHTAPYNTLSPTGHTVKYAGSHLAEPFTRAAQTVAGLDDGGRECSTCHSAALIAAHSDAPAVSCVTGGAGGKGCHLDTTKNSLSVASTGWTTEKCTECHNYGANVSHDSTATAHLVVSNGCAGSAASCHASNDLWAMHEVGQDGGPRTYAGCANTGCHSTLDRRPTVNVANSCGSTSTGCHQDKTISNHGGNHEFNAAGSVYNNTTQTGCTDSGAGCHGVAPATYADATIHTDAASCMSGACHTAANHNEAQFDDPNTCQNCHGGGVLLYDNAADTVGLTDVAPNGHYSETTHTATGMAATVSAGGTYSAACSDCHNPVNASGIDGLYFQHQGLGGGLGATTCSDCHNANAAIQTIVTDTVRNETCNACHTASVLPTMVQHGSSTTTATGIEAQGAGTCVSAQCHASVDLHALHKDNKTGNANGCTMTGCHDITKQGVKPTLKSCGTGGDCHTVAPVHPNEAAKHTTMASGSCITCHETGDLKLVHGDQCTKCHGNSTYPLLPTGKLECISCHNGVDVGLHVYDPYDPEHYTTENHMALGTDTGIANTGGKACTICHMMEMKPEHMEKTTSAFPSVPGTYESKCVACHETKVDGFAGAWGELCVECHAAGSVHTDTATKHDLTAGNSACAGSDCHNTADGMAIHASGLPGNGDCMNCHDGNWHVPDKLLCADCHVAPHPASATVHASATTACTVCHTSKTDVATGHASCATCHEDARLTDYLQNNYTPTCTDCHMSGIIGTKTYSPADPNHATGNEATHTATPWTLAAQGTGADGAVATEGEECSLCHSSTLKAAHASTSTNGGSVTCTECHTDVSLGSSQTVAANWTNDRCTDCHDYGPARTHDGMATVHVVAAGTCADTGSSCHNYTDLAKMHDVSQSGGTRKYAGCENTGCHVTNNTRPSALASPSCGEGTTGCHTDKNPTNHGGKHTLNFVGSNYNNTAQTGCTNSGAGCHGTSAGTNITEYHPTSGCTSGPCHTSVDKPTHHEPFVCGDCHDSTYAGAADTTALAEAAPAGHYSETTHTASGMTNTVSAGGTYSATCATCHNPVGAGVDGLYNQHQGLDVLGSTTCSDCHNANAAISTLVTDGTRTDACAACHTAGVLPTMVQHGSTAPAVTGTEASGAGSCQATGCHSTLDLHALHANNNSGNANGCTMANCHDATKQGVKPTAKSCGTGGACHNSSPIHPTEAAKHTTLASAQCVVCHELGGDLKLTHADVCGTCHGNATYPALPAGKLECTSCHNGVDVGLHVYDPTDPNHYMAANHTAGDAEAGISNTGGKNCSVCHQLEMKPEHWRSTTDTSTLGAYANTCIGCHEVKVDNLVAWAGTCQECHAPAGVHTAYTADHDYTAGNSACAGATCHNTADAAALHVSSLPGAGDCTSCHNNTTLPNKVLCADCHTAHPAQATVHTSTETECLNCHSTKTDISTGHASCATCHANATLVDYLQNNYTPTCTSCHNAALIGLKLYTPADPNHYGVIIHSASPFTYVYQGTGADGAVPAETTECNTCHSAAMKVAHSNTSTNGGSVVCIECHNDTTLNSKTVISGNWPNDRCTDCHDYGAARTHDGMATVHVVSTARGCAASGASCHNHTDVAKMHNVSQSGGAAKYAKCENAGCHVTNDARPAGTLAASDSCGEGSTGCHLDKTTTNHGGKHTLDLAGSNYNNTTVSGCTNAGAGCHGNSAGTSITEYHPTSGCTEGPCHTSVSKPSKTEPFTCMTCHDGTYVNAVDTVGLTDGAPTGHYSEATHTVGSMTATISAGGTYSASCATCHNPDNAGSIDYLYNQHQGLDGLGSTTCSDCHNKNAAIQTIVTDAVRTDTCDGCHNATVLPTMVMHGLTAPVVNGTEAGGLGSCVTGGCHATLDLHALHKSDVTGNPNSCTMAGCHDPNTQGFKPTPNSCGTGGNCHTTDPHNPMAHITIASSACVVCHESTDLRVVHGQNCVNCHDNPSYPSFPAGKLECLSCHDGSTIPTKTYSPVDPDHYTGTETTHTASAAQSSSTYQGFVCTTCHLMEMKPEHAKVNVTFSAVPGTYSTKCIACHESKVDGFTLPWDQTCANCHSVKHNLQATKHDATAVGGTCATTLTTTTVESENFDSVTAPAWPATGWTRSNTAGKVVTNTTQKHSGANSGAFVNTAGTTEYFEKSFDLSTYQNPQISFWRYTANLDATVDNLRVAYSTNGGGSWTDIYPASNNNSAAWVQVGPVSLPASATVLVRFSGANNLANETIYIDDILITGMSGKTCHNVSDVSVIHNNSVPYVSQADTDLCTTCHTTNTAVPTILTCVDASCHGGIHNVDHTAVASPECLSCHSATNDVRIIHAAKGDGCNVCHGGGGFTDVHDGKTAECAQSGCHATEAPVNANHYTGTETTHTAGVAQSGATLGAWALSPQCGACHGMELLPEHDAATALKTTVPANVCENCHLSTVLTSAPTVVAGDWTEKSTTGACIACHPATVPTDMHGQTAISGNHAITNDTQSCASSGAGCHPVSNVSQVGTPSTTANVHTACASCHGTASRAGLVTPGSLAQGCTGNTNCHATNYATNNHNALTGNEAVHTASGMGTDLDGSYTNYDACSNCHSAGLALAHNDASTTANLISGNTAWSSTAQSTCRDCHNAAATATTVASAGVIKGNWAAKTCAECHTTKHNTYTAARHQSPAGSGCTLSNGCHGYTGATLDVRALHDKASSGCTTNGTDGKNWTGGCHALDRQMSTANMSCGSGATGQACHTNHTHTNHGPDHTYTTASDYTQTADTVGSETGCAGSGAGCHGTITAERDAINDFHDADTIAGCTTGDKCHTSSTMTQVWKDGGVRADCLRCHNNNFVGAPDKMPLFEAASAGHYGEATHTATSGLGNMTAGGSALAACSVCHDTTIRNAHGAAGGGFSSKTKGAYVTCQECHGYNAATSAVTTDTVRTDSCSACHTSGVLGATQAMHNAATAPTALSTSVGCGNTGIGCHNTLDLHTIHRNAAGGCVLSGCHAKNKDMTSSSVTCGEATGCHLNTLYVPTWHNGTGGLADGYDSDHHIAGTTQMNATYTYNSKTTACSACHSGSLGTEHTRATSALSAAGATTCLKCHNDSATVAGIVNTSWPNKNTTSSCASCHTGPDDATAANAAHGNVGTHSTGTAVTGCSDKGAGCHGVGPTVDLTTVHYSGCALTRACHSTTVYNAGVKTCTSAACHPSANYNVTTYAHNTVNGTDETHTVTPTSMTTTLSAGGPTFSSCASCHSMTLKASHNVAVGYATNSLSWSSECLGCHNATSPVVVKDIALARIWGGTCLSNGCHNTTQSTHVDGGTDTPAVTGIEADGATSCVKGGCHTTLDLHQLHKGDGEAPEPSCATLDCHDVAHTDQRPTKKSCGTAGQCHLVDPHNPLAHTTQSSGDCVACHESPVLQIVHESRCSDCHGNATYPFLPGTLYAYRECTACHTSGVVGAKNYVSVDTSHYAGTETSHTASSQTGNVGGYACSQCHKLEMKPEHIVKTSSSFSTTTTAFGKCVVCHETKVDDLPILPWEKTCVACHAVNHLDKDAKHDATAVGGTCAGSAVETTVNVESFDSVTAPAWPATAWTRGGTDPTRWMTDAVVRNTLPNSAMFASDVNGTIRTGYFEQTFDLSGYTNPQISFYYSIAGSGDDWLEVQYSTNGGGSWTNILARTTASVGIMQVGPVPVPQSAGVIIRFNAYSNRTANKIYVDSIVLTGLTGSSCHQVSDVSVIHNNSVSSVTTADTLTCRVCHVNNDGVPTILTCADASCHAGVHNQDHIETGSVECLSCHSVSNDTRVIHAGVGDGCNVCHGGGGYTDVHSGKTSACAQSGCHAPEAPVNPNHYTGTETSHTAGATQMNSTLGVWALSPTCVTCHDNTLLTEHSEATADKTTVPANICENCHLSTAAATINSSATVASDWTARDTVNACIACHALDTVTTKHGQTAISGNHAVTNDTQSCASSGAGCHPVSNVSQVGTPSTIANIHLDCGACHDKESSAHLIVTGALAQGCTNNAACHTVGFSTDNHNYADGDEAWHTASGMNTSLDTYTYGDLCNNCHSTTLGLAHKDTSTTANLISGKTAWNATAQSSCRDCHNATATATTVASGGVVKSSWATKTCAECHTTKHNTYTLARHQSPAGSGCTLSVGCHGYTGSTLDVRPLHDRVTSGCSAAGEDNKLWSGACHALDKQMSTANMSCGSGAAGQACHTNHTHLNHGPDHNYTVASDYNQALDTVGSETGCTNSGIGCHGVAGAQRDAVEELHDADTKAGCTATDKCHGSPSMTQVWKDGGSGNDCSRCHNGGFTNAADVMALYEASSAGHYKETTHTPTGMTATVSSGGTASAACTVCHDTSLRNTHGAAGGGFSSKTKGTYVTCSECHGYNAAVSALTTDTVRTDTCAACHTAGVLGATQAMHGTTAPVATGSSTAGCGAQGAGCHNTYDLHTLHKDNSCTLAGCHDAKNKDMTTVAKACGGATGCHLSSTYTNTLHNGLNGDDLTKHRAQSDETSSLPGFVKSTSCTLCHTSTLKTAHNTTPAWTTPYCLNCHNSTAPINAVNVIKNTTWANGSCGACHTVKHDLMTLSHDGSVVGIGCAPPPAGGTPTRVDYHLENFDGVTAPAFPTTWTKGGSNPTQMVTTNTSSTSSPNSARFAASSASAQSAYFERTFDLSAVDDPEISFKYSTAYTGSGGMVVKTLDAIVTDQANWTASAGDEVTAVQSTDGIHIINKARNSTAEQIYSLADVDPAWTIDSVKMYVVSADQNSRGLTATARTGGVTVDSIVVPNNSLDTWAETSKVLAAPTGGWTAANLNALEVGVKPTTAVNNTALGIKVDRVWFEVTYSAASANNYAKAEYSTDGGSSWTSLLATVSASTPWTNVGPVALPMLSNVQVRFIAGSDNTTQLSQFDDIVVTHVVTAPSTESIFNEKFDSVTAPAWPATFTRGGTDSTLIVTSSTTNNSAPNAAKFASSNTAARTAYFDRTFDLTNRRDPKISFWYSLVGTDDANDYLRVAYSTNGGANWTDMLAQTSTAVGWTQFTSAELPAVPNVLVRFFVGSNNTADIIYVDDIDLFVVPGSPCHDVSDVSLIHDTATGPGCVACHTAPETLPITKTCSAVGCHATGANHDVLHQTTTASNYADGSGQGTEVGCTNSGAGCHLTSTMPVNGASTFHPASGCLDGSCHMSASMTTAFKGATDGMECVRCHDGAFVGASDATALADVYPAGHYGETTHTAVGGLAVPVTAGGTATGTCSGCHDLSLKTAHSSAGFISDDGVALGTKVTCAECHNSYSAVVDGHWSGAACTACHSIATRDHIDGGTVGTVTGSSTAGCGASGAGCHNTYDLHSIHKDATGGCTLTGCHDAKNKDMTASAKTCGQATGCHLSTIYTPTLHNGTGGLADGDDTTHHNASANSAQSIGGYTLSTACTGCHTLTMKTAHATTSLASDPSCSTGGTGGTGCHNQTTPINATPQVTSDWVARTCEACHTTKHTTYTAAAHTSTTSGCTLASGCHGFSGSQSMDIRGLHDVTAGCTASGTDGKLWTGACHQLNKSMVGTTMTCGDTGACHNNHTAVNHGPDHDYTTASNYIQTGADVIGGESGCTASGTGCHNSATTGNTVDLFHTAVATGCTATDACHSDPQFDVTFKSGTTANCSRCHGGATDPGIGSDNAPLFEASSAGHYDETLHTATAGLGNVTAGGTATSACASCHDLGLRNAHGAGGGGFSSTTKGVYVTCQECHAYNANVTSEVKTLSWQNNNCADCHNATDMATSVMHNATTAPVVNGTSTVGCGASGIGCHGTYDLHALHKDAASCAITGCHAKNKNMAAVDKTCGEAGDCHNNTNFTATQHNGSTRGLVNGTDTSHTAGATQMTATYTLDTKTAACSACHAAALFTEHNRATSTLSAAGATKCLQCHNDSATTAGIVNADWVAQNTTTACSVCHANTDATSAQTAHGFATTNHTGTSVTGCTALGAGCHGTLATPSLTTVHTTGCALTRACHSPTVYNPGIKACTNAACHSTATYNTTTYAHGTVNGTEATHTVTAGSMSTTVGYGTGTATAACSVCHSTTLSTAHNPAAGYATNSLGGLWLNTNGTCVGCHNATTPIVVATMVTNNTWTDTCLSGGCHNTTQQAHVDGGTDTPAVTGTESAGAGTCNKTGCHTSVDLHALHKDAVSCALTNCHVVANVDKRPTVKTCGTGGTCHVGYESGAHAVSSGGSACDTCHSGKTGMVNDTATFHHVLDGTAYRAPGSGTTYPTSTSALECVSCHTDHNYFNAAKGSNLRQAIGTQGSSYTNTDFLTSGTFGICVSCHSAAQTKNTTGQKVIAGRPTATRIISGANFNTSKHNYVINDATKIGFGTAAFQANCTKCHDDEQDTGSKMTSTYKLGLHTSAEASLIKALGVTLVGTNYAEEGVCYKCHTGGTAGPDGYGVNPGGTAMRAGARGIQAAFSGAYGHEPSNYVNIHRDDEYTGAPTSIIGETVSSAGWWGTGNANKHVECEDCHDVHTAKAPTYTMTNDNASPRANNVAPAISAAVEGWGVTISGPGVASSAGNWAGSGTAGSGTPKYPTYAKTTSAAYEWQLCLKCHSRYAWGNQTPPAVPSLGANATTAEMTDVGRDFDPSNYAFHPLFRVGLNQPGTTLNGNWNSQTARRNISGSTSGNGLSNTFVDGWLSTSRVTCQDCHTSSGVTEGAHGSSSKWMIRAANTAVKVTIAAGTVVNINSAATAGSYCQNCHRLDVYGDGAGGGATDTKSASLLSRANHGSGFTSCMASSKVPNQVNGCNNCHGGRPNAAGTGTIENGFIHGSNSPAGSLGDALGKRFCNGASWDAHQLGQGGAAIGCSTLNATDGYSSCTQHTATWGKTVTPLYDY